MANTRPQPRTQCCHSTIPNITLGGRSVHMGWQGGLVFPERSPGPKQQSSPKQ